MAESIVRMPAAALDCMVELQLVDLALTDQVRGRRRGLDQELERGAATGEPLRVMSCCDTTPRSEVESIVRTWLCLSAAGVDDAVHGLGRRAVRVQRRHHEDAHLAAVIVVDIVARSRIRRPAEAIRYSNEAGTPQKKLWHCQIAGSRYCSSKL